jgi:two-component system, sensor histidine kinase LadS
MYTQLFTPQRSALQGKTLRFFYAFSRWLALMALVLGALSHPSSAQTRPKEAADSVPALPQAPQRASASPTLNAVAYTLTPIELGDQVKSIPIDTYSQYWIDELGSATIEQVDALSPNPGMFAPRSSAQRHSIHGKVLWLRFDARITDKRSHWFLETAMDSADNVALYWRDTNNQWLTLRAGDVVERNLWPVQNRYPAFQLNQEHVGPSVYYVRVEQDRLPFSAPLHIYRDIELVAQGQVSYFFLGGYFGLLALVALICMVMASAMRDRSFLIYAVYVTALGISQASISGIAAQYVWNDSPTWSNLSVFFLTSLSAAACLWFVRSVAQPRLYSTELDSIVLLLMGTQIGLAFVDLAYPSLAGFRLSTILNMGIVLAVCAMVWRGWLRGDPVMRLLGFGFLPVLMGVTPLILANAGLISTGFFVQHGLSIGSAIQMPMLMYLLLLRSAHRRESRARTAGLPMQDALTGLSNTRNLLGQIHGAMTRAARYNYQYGLVLVELSNHDWFHKEHGREMSDRALVLLGTRLQLIARDVDTTARIDDTHFLLLIDGPCKPSRAAKVAAQIAASAHRPTDLLPVGASLKLRVTCALMPDAQALELGDDANAQLGWLLESSESLPDNPRKLVRTLNF